MSTVSFAWGHIQHGQLITWRMNMPLMPVFEVKMKPKSESPIVYLVARVITDDSDKLMDFIDATFPDYQIEHIIGGYARLKDEEKE